MPVRRRSRISKTILVLISFLALPGGSQAEDLLWPLDVSKILTSTFGEYRPTHFHAGLDFSTGQREGLPVHAVGDGKVYRLRTSPYGYGKAIYQTLSGGRRAVYAHLADFSVKLEIPVEREQERLGRYRTDLTLSEPIPVRRGEVIGFSGSTGTGAPHLHLEIRNSSDEPINPVPNIYSVPDMVPPIIDAVWLIPAGEDSLIDGLPEPMRIPMSPDTAQTMYRGNIVHAVGTYHMAVETSDRQGPAQHRLGVRSVTLESEGKVLHKVRFEGFSYQTGRKVRASYNHPIQVTTGTPSINLFDFTDPDGPLPGNSDAGDATAGPHQYKITVTDGAGNESVALLTVEGEENPALTGQRHEARSRRRPEKAESADPINASVRRFHDRVLVDLSFSKHLQGQPRAEFVPVEGPARHIPVFRRDSHRFLAYLPTPILPNVKGTLKISASVPNPENIEIAIWGEAYRPGASQILRADDEGAEVTFAENTFFRPTAVYLERSDSSVRTSMEPLSSLFKVGPITEPCASSFQIRIRAADSSDPRAALYWINGKKPRFVVKRKGSSTEWISARVDTMGLYQVFLDDTPPVVRLLTPDSRGLKSSELPVIALEVNDRESGINADSIRILLDGKPIICEYDPGEMRIFRKLRRELEPGEHRIEASLEDNAGNAALLEKTFAVSEN